jgi:hypothetical protein
VRASEFRERARNRDFPGLAARLPKNSPDLNRQAQTTEGYFSPAKQMRGCDSIAGLRGTFHECGNFSFPLVCA